MMRLMEDFTTYPKRLLLGGFPHIALFSFPWMESLVVSDPNPQTFPTPSAMYWPSSSPTNPFIHAYPVA